MDWNRYPYLGSERGTRLGVHTQGTADTANIMRRGLAAGVRFAVAKAVGVPNVLTDFRIESPETIRVYRVLLNHPIDPLNDLLQPWFDPESVAQYAMSKVQHELDLADAPDAYHFLEIFNEMDPPAPGGAGPNPDAWRQVALIFKRCAEIATGRGIHLAIGGLAAGTPEYSEMQAMIDTGIFEALRTGRHAFSVHEGVFDAGAGINDGFGDLIPGAPAVPEDAGSMCGRFRYLYSQLSESQIVPLLVSEFYLSGPGAGYSDWEYTVRTQWYDRLVRRYPYVLGFCPFTLDPAGGTTDGVNYNFAYPKMIEYMATIRDQANPTGAPPVNPPAPRVVKVAWNAYNKWRVRLGPGTDYAPCGAVSAGSVLPVLSAAAGRTWGRPETWFQVIPDGFQDESPAGWIAGSAVTIVA
jgi:hypothetical protein